MKTVGLIGGMSWKSTALYYQLLNKGIQEKLGDLHSAKILLASVDFQEIETLMQNQDWQILGSIMADIAKNLERAGADFILLCTNTIHKVADQIEDAISIPFLHLADATGQTVSEQKIKTVGLLGTSVTMEEDFYKKRLEDTFKLDVLIPNNEDRNLVNRVIFQELCRGEIHSDSKHEYLRIIEELRLKGAEGVILGCTEIAMLLKPEESTIPLFDTTNIHARAAILQMLDD